MKLFHKSYDGGPDSGVTGYWLIENKKLFSIVLLHFSPGSREAFHSHAFNAVTWWLKGRVTEQTYHPHGESSRVWWPSWKPKYTPRDIMHKVIAGPRGAWAISFRGPWKETWQEHKRGKTYTLGHGRRLINGS